VDIESPAAFLCLVMPFVHFIALSTNLTFCTAEDSITEKQCITQSYNRRSEDAQVC
jgi:hypothetical protein